MEGGGERKRKLVLDSDKLLPGDDNDTILVAKPPATARKPMTEGRENSSTGNDVQNMTIDQLNDLIKRLKVMYYSSCDELPDHGEKLLVELKRLEEELERKNQEIRDVQNLTNDELICRIERMKFISPSICPYLFDRGEKFLARLKLLEEELERRKHQQDDGRNKKPKSEDQTRGEDMFDPGPLKRFVVRKKAKLEAEKSRGNSPRQLVGASDGKEGRALNPSQGCDALQTFSIQCLSAAEGIIRFAEAFMSHVDKLTRMLEAEKRKYDSEKARFELEKKNLEEEKVKLETKLQEALDRERRAVEDSERAQATADARQRRISLLMGEKERIVMETINEFKKSDEYDTIMGKYGMDSYKYGLKQVRAWVKLHAPNLDTSVFKDFPSAAEDLDLSQFPDSEPDQGSPDGTLPKGSRTMIAIT